MHAQSIFMRNEGFTGYGLKEASNLNPSSQF